MSHGDAAATPTHRAGGTHPVYNVGPPARWVEFNFPTGINQGQCSRPQNAQCAMHNALHNVHSHLGYIIPVVTAMPRPGRYRLHARTMIKHCHRPPCLAMLPNCAGATPLKMFWILYSIKTGARSCSVGQLSISLLTLFWRL